MAKLIVLHRNGTWDDAKDILQEGLMIILEKIDRREFTLTCSFKTYLYCVCENLWEVVIEKRRAAFNYFRRKSAEEKEKNAEEMIDDRAREDIFRDAFESLDEVSRKILTLCWQDISGQEAADQLGYAYSYVRRKKCQAMAELLAKVKAHPGYREIMNSEKVAGKVVY